MNIINNNSDSTFEVKLHSDINDIYIYNVRFKSNSLCIPSRIAVEFNIPHINAFSLWNSQCGSVWNSQCGTVRNILPDWREQHQVSSSRLASGIPIQSVISQSGNNVFTISVLDAKTPIEISTATEEFNKSCLCRIAFFHNSYRCDFGI